MEKPSSIHDCEREWEGLRRVIDAITGGERTWCGITSRVGRDGGPLSRVMRWLWDATSGSEIDVVAVGAEGDVLVHFALFSGGGASAEILREAEAGRVLHFPAEALYR